LWQPGQDFFDQELNPGVVEFTLFACLKGGTYRAASLVAQHYKELSPQMTARILQTPGYFGREYISSDAYDEQVTEADIKDQFRRNA
jgi:hypothetical protein